MLNLLEVASFQTIPKSSSFLQCLLYNSNKYFYVHYSLNRVIRQFIHRAHIE